MERDPLPGLDRFPGVMNAGAGGILRQRPWAPASETPVVLAGSGPSLPCGAEPSDPQGHPSPPCWIRRRPATCSRAAPSRQGCSACPCCSGAIRCSTTCGRGRTPVPRRQRHRGARSAGSYERVPSFQGTRTRWKPQPCHGRVIPCAHSRRAGILPHHWDARQQCWTVACDGCEKDGAGRRVRRRGLQPRTRYRRRGMAGELAGLAVAERQEGIGRRNSRRRSACCVPCRTDGIQGFSLDAWFSPRRDLYAVPDDVAVCRCECGGYPGSRPRRPDRHQRSKAAHAGGHGQLPGRDLRPGS